MVKFILINRLQSWQKKLVLGCVILPVASGDITQPRTNFFGQLCSCVIWKRQGGHTVKTMYCNVKLLLGNGLQCHYFPTTLPHLTSLPLVLVHPPISLWEPEKRLTTAPPPPPPPSIYPRVLSFLRTDALDGRTDDGRAFPSLPGLEMWH